MADTCPSCAPHPDHEPGQCQKPARAPEGASFARPGEPFRCQCKADVWAHADATAAKSLEKLAAEVRKEVESHRGYTFRGLVREKWTARGPKGSTLSADSGPELVRKVRAAAGQPEVSPVQEGFGW